MEHSSGQSRGPGYAHRTKKLRAAAIVFFWLTVWQGISVAVGNSIILVGPLAVLESLITQAVQWEFWKTILSSFIKLAAGFLAAFTVGLALGSLAYRFSFMEELFAPMTALLKSIPVASFVILALIWIGSENLSIFISFVVVVPVVYVNTVSGLLKTDKKLLEMAQVFHMPTARKIRYLYLPALMPYLLTSCRTAIGMSIKSGVAAEVIGVPDYSIGEKLYLSKIYLDTAGLFAWTLVIIAISSVFERLFLYLLGKIR